MGRSPRTTALHLATVLAIISYSHNLCIATPPSFFPEQRQIKVRDPSQLPHAHMRPVAAPATVISPDGAFPERQLTLDEAIGIALTNSGVVRVLGGSSGRTIYDPAIANTRIDQQRGAFDPTISIGNEFQQSRLPTVSGGFGDPVSIDGDRTDDYQMSLGMSRRATTGATLGMGVNANPSYSTADPFLLNPRSRSSVDFSLTQPLLQGAGRGANLAFIEVAQIDTERSFFQLKDAVQEMVRGVSEAYWSLVAARTNVWVRRQQVQQGQAAFKRAEDFVVGGFGDAGEETQTRAAVAGFRASLVTAQGSVLQREAALRNILGMPPTDGFMLVPVSAPFDTLIEFGWEEVLSVAETYRPDLIELKLILEADEQRLLRARNDSLPQLDAVVRYRWDGLRGTTPDRRILQSGPGQFTGWTLGVNFSVPLGLRSARSELRQQELVLMRDRANLQQGLHNATHRLAATYRNLIQFHEQYKAFKEEREASYDNLAHQGERYHAGIDTAIYLNVLQAITQWGNSLNSEAQSLLQYNTELANMQRETGSILEVHGIRFAEERFGSIGPLGRKFAQPCYPMDQRPTGNSPRYDNLSEPSENVFDLDDPIPERRTSTPQGLPGPPESDTILPESIETPLSQPPDVLRLDRMLESLPPRAP